MPINAWIKEEQSIDLVDTSFSTLTNPGSVVDKGLSTLGIGTKDAMGPEERYWIDMGTTILGLNKKYRDSSWVEKQTEASVIHLRNFVKLFVNRTGKNREDVISCLGFLGGAYESGKFPKGCDFSPDYLRKLCNKPT